MLLLPVTMLIPRVRAFTDKRWWFPLHLSSAAFASLGMVYVAFVTAVSRFHGGIDSQHRVSGNLPPAKHFDHFSWLHPVLVSQNMIWDSYRI